MRSSTDVWLGLVEGDTIILPVDWFDDREVRTFTVTRMPSTWELKDLVRRGRCTATIGLEGEDGHTYTNYLDRPVIECTDDGKEGLHRGNQSGSPTPVA